MGDALSTVLVVAYRRPESLDRLLRGLSGSVRVANVGNDRDVSVVAKRHGAELVEVPGNPGWAGAVNAGMRGVTTDIVVLLNDDLVISQESVDRLIDAVRAGADVAGPAYRDRLGNSELSVIGLPTVGQTILTLVLPDRPIRGLRWLGPAKWTTDQVPRRVHALTGAALAVRTHLLQTRPIPEAYFLYWEETEWFWHLHQAGARVELRPEAIAHNQGGRGVVEVHKSALLSRNAVRCVRRTQGRSAAAAIWPVVVLSAARLFVVDTARRWGGTVARERVAARRAGFLAALRAVGEI